MDWTPIYNFPSKVIFHFNNPTPSSALHRDPNETVEKVNLLEFQFLLIAIFDNNRF